MTSFIFVSVLLACLANLSAGQQEVCYPPCGCFSNAAPFNDRPLPESYDVQEIVWYLYTPTNPNVGVPIRWDNIPALFDPSRRTVYLIHGWTSNTSFQESIKDAFLQSGKDYNVIVVDWETGAAKPLNYPLAASNTRVVGACSGHLATVLSAEEGGDLANHYCAGHSLGGQTCGYMGKFTEGQLGRITGLDPAGPLFDTDDIRVRLDKSDTLYMDNLHTNAQVLGIGRNVGHADFYPNKGGQQPPCYGPTPPWPVVGCDHGVCLHYFMLSINTTCEFRANPCSTTEDADAGLCDECVEGVDCQRMGYHSDDMWYESDEQATGGYYLLTQENWPFCVDEN